MAGYLAKLKTIADEVKGRGFEIVEMEIAEPVPQETLAEFQRVNGLSETVLDFWREANGFRLEWKGELNTRGGFSIPSIEEAFGDLEGKVYFDFTPPDAPERKLHPIDNFLFDNGAVIGVLIDGSENPKVHFKDDEVYPLEVDLAGYIDLLVKTRGFNYWQQAVASDRSGETENTTSAAEFRALMPKLFPDFKLSDVLRRDYAEDDGKRIQAFEELQKQIASELESVGATFVAQENASRSGAVTFKVSDVPSGNLKKVEGALMALQGSSWQGLSKSGAMSVGNLMVVVEGGSSGGSQGESLQEKLMKLPLLVRRIVVVSVGAVLFVIAAVVLGVIKMILPAGDPSSVTTSKSQPASAKAAAVTPAPAAAAPMAAAIAPAAAAPKAAAAAPAKTPPPTPPKPKKK